MTVVDSKRVCVPESGSRPAWLLCAGGRGPKLGAADDSLGEVSDGGGLSGVLNAGFFGRRAGRSSEGARGGVTWVPRTWGCVCCIKRCLGASANPGSVG
jgi:hypothetical protein